jgi:WD40 repeat protein
MQPQPTSQAYVPGDAYVPPPTPGAPSPQPGAPAAAATPRILFTGDGKLLIVAAGGAVESCDLTSGQRHALGASIGDASVMTVSPDGRTIVTHDAGGTVRLFDAATWLAQTKTYSPGVAGVTAIALSPDGRTLALAGKGVAIWDLVDGKTRNTLHGNDACSSVSFSADGKSLAVATAEGATIWETTLWQKQITLGAGGGAGIVRFWRARSALGVAAADQTVRIYDLATNQVQATLNAGAPISDFALSSDGRSVAATIGNGQLTVWDSATGVPRKLP